MNKQGMSDPSKERLRERQMALEIEVVFEPSMVYLHGRFSAEDLKVILAKLEDERG